MRPPGIYGDVALALRSAAQQGPGTVRALAERACVGYGAARYTASRLVARGDLVVAADGRPAVLALNAADDAGSGAGDGYAMLDSCFWRMCAPAGGEGSG